MVSTSLGLGEDGMQVESPLKGREAHKFRACTGRHGVSRKVYWLYGDFGR